MKLLFTLQTGHISSDKDLVINLARQALESKDQVTIFLMGEGVVHITDPDISDLIKSGATVSICEHNRKEFHIEARPDLIKYESQYEFACYLNEADRLISFLPR